MPFNGEPDAGLTCDERITVYAAAILEDVVPASE